MRRCEISAYQPRISWSPTHQETLASDLLDEFPLGGAGSGVGLLDGTTGAAEWVGWIPFSELPHTRNPAQGYLFSANQQPVGGAYPYYLGHDWPDPYRALRIDQMLRAQPLHSVSDIAVYQSDVHVVQRDLFTPFLEGVDSLSAEAEEVRDLIRSWDGRGDAQ